MFGVTHIVDVLRGSRRADLLRWHHDRVPEYGAGQDQAAAEWRRQAEEFIRQGLLEQDMGHGSLRLTTRGQAVLDGAQVSVPAAAPRIAALPEAELAYDTALFGRLRTLRRELAEAADLPPFVIFSDRSLAEMAACFPQTPASFLAIHGVGQRKLAQYGEPFLAAIRAYCAEHGLANGPKRPRRPRPNAGRLAREPHGRGRRAVRRRSLGSQDPGVVRRDTGHCHPASRHAAFWAGQRFAPERIRELSQLSAEDQVARAGGRPSTARRGSSRSSRRWGGRSPTTSCT